MPSSFQTRKKQTAKKQILQTIVLAPTILVILVAVWVSGAAIVENVHFAHATDQILRLVSTMHDIAATDKNFAVLADQDVLAILSHSELLSGVVEGNPAIIYNPWNGAISSKTLGSSTVRIESSLPPRDCRRLALFFVKNGNDLGMRLMEVREDGAKIWRRLYDHAFNPPVPMNQSIETACGQSPRVTLALVFAMR